MIQPFCEHLLSFDENFMLRDPEAFSSHDKKCSYGYKCCESHLWTIIKENQLDQIHAFIWKINDIVFDPRHMNFNLDHSAEEQTNKGILLKVTYIRLTGNPPSYNFSTPFGKVNFPLPAIALHKSPPRFLDFIQKYPLEELSKDAFSTNFSLKYSENAHPVEPHLANQKRCVEILSKIWSLLENERLKTPASHLQSLSINTLSPESVIKFEIREEDSYNTYPYYEVMKFDKNKEKKRFANKLVRKYFLSMKEFKREESKENSRYTLDQATICEFKFNFCTITLLDRRRVSLYLNQAEIGILFKEMLPKVLIESGYRSCEGAPFEGKVVNRNATEVLSDLFKNVQPPLGWCRT